MKSKLTIGKFLSAVVLLASSSLASGDDWAIDWYTVDAGGEMFATEDSPDPDWDLSATIAQWEVDMDQPAEGGAWSLVAGFWAFTAPPSDLVFVNRFE